MVAVIEDEIIGEINKEIFLRKRDEFTRKFGEPGKKRRLGLMVFDRNNPKVDTRIRITNGLAEIMQKVIQNEDGLGHSKKQEISIKIPEDAESVFNSFQAFSNLLKEKYCEKLIRLLIQTENYIWKLPDYELKLSYQFGKNDYYTYEIEAISKACDLHKVQLDLGLTPIENHASPERKLFRTTQVDLNADEMTEEEIKAVIGRYFEII